MHEVSPATFPKHKLCIILFLAGLECLLFAATLIGWPSIVYVFKGDGVFSHLCANVTNTNVTQERQDIDVSDSVTLAQPLPPKQSKINESTLPQDHPAAYPRCSAQDRMLSLIFTIAQMFWGVVGIPLGWFFDRFGLLKTRAIAVTCGSIGFLMFAWAGSDQYTSYLLFPGSMFMVTASFSTILSCTHMAALAGAHATTVLSIYCGAWCSSIIVFFLVKIVHGEGISRNISLTVVAAYWIIILLYSLAIMPRYKVDEVGHANGGKECDSVATTKVPYSDGDEGITPKSTKVDQSLSESNGSMFHTNQDSAEPTRDPQARTLWQCMRTFPYVLLIVWFASIHVAYHTFLGMYNLWVTLLTQNDDKLVNHLTNILAYCQLCSLLIGPIAGAIIDFCKRRLTAQGDMPQGVATVPCMIIVCTMSIVLHVCVIVNRVNAVYVSAIVSEITRTFLFPSALAFIAITFPGQHYGTLFGIANFIACISNLLQYPLFIWADSSNSYSGVSIFLLVLSVIGFCLPIYMTVLSIKGAKKMN